MINPYDVCSQPIELLKRVIAGILIFSILTAFTPRFSFFPGVAHAHSGETHCPHEDRPVKPREPRVLTDSLDHSQSAPTRRSEVLTDQPNAPPQLARKIDVEFFGCRRQFLYRGVLMPIDSNNRTDAERLRPILEPAPEALAALNDYQRTQRHARVAGYVGTAGVILALAAFVVGNQMQDPSGSISSTGVAVRNIGVLGGLGIGVGSFFYAKGLLSTNETNLGRAVDLYNRARPNDAIELQFRTRFDFEDLVPGD